MENKEKFWVSVGDFSKSHRIKPHQIYNFIKCGKIKSDDWRKVEYISNADPTDIIVRYQINFNAEIL